MYCRAAHFEGGSIHTQRAKFSTSCLILQGSFASRARQHHQAEKRHKRDWKKVHRLLNPLKQRRWSQAVLFSSKLLWMGTPQKVCMHLSTLTPLTTRC